MVRFFICINIGLSITYAIIWFSVLWGNLYWKADFTAFYTGLIIVRDGFGSCLFDFDLQATFQQNILDDKIFRDGLLPFVWPPHTIPPLIPLAWLSLKNAYTAFSILQIISLLGIVYLVKIILQNFIPEIKILCAVLLTALPATCYSLIIGNYSIFILLSILGFYYSIKKKNDFSAGAWLALGSVKPQLVLMPVLMLIAGKKWKSVSGFVVSILPFIALSIYMFGWKIWIYYLIIIKEFGKYLDYMGVYPEAMYNLKGILYSISGNQHVNAITTLTLIGLLLSVVLTTFLWHKKFDTQSSDFELRFALTVLLGLFFSPHLNGHDYVLVFAALMALIVYTGNSNASLSLVKLFSIFPVLFLATEIVFKINVGIKFPTLVMIVMMVWISWKLVRDHRTHA